MTTATKPAGTSDRLARFEWRMDGSVSVRIAAPADVIYDRVSDITRTGDQSLECREAEWLPGPPPGVVGARFRGRNKSGLARWTRRCEVVEAERGRRFAFRTLPSRWDFTRFDSTIWGYAIEPDGNACVVTHYYRIVRRPVPGFRQLLALMFPHHRDMRPHLEHTLRAIKAEAETGRG